MPPNEPLTMTPAMMFAALDAWVKSFDPDACDLQIVYRARGAIGHILVPSPREQSDEDTVIELTEMQAAVLQAVRDEMKPGDTGSMEEIAMKSGYFCSGKLRDYVRSIAPILKLRSTNRGWVKP